MRSSHRWFFVAVVLAVVGVAYPLLAATRRPLRVVVYPFVPDKAGYFFSLEQTFENANPEIDLQIVDLSSNYYDEDEAAAITNTDADVYELDSVFLDDFVKAGKLQQLSASLKPATGTFLTVADAAAQSGGNWYGVPHWVCTNYLMFRAGDRLEEATNLQQITDLIGTNRVASVGLLVDLKGKSTLGELYLDAFLDEHGTLADLPDHLTEQTLDSTAVAALLTSRRLCDADMCRDSKYHDMEGFYPRQFARGSGRALAGYSERLFYIGSEEKKACPRNTCLKLSEVDVRPLALSDKGSTPFAWVDMFSISTNCSGQCLADAETFVKLAAAASTVRSALIPGWGEAPRYLLPALTELYTDSALLAEAPLYAKLLAGVESATAVRGEKLNQQLRAVGKILDKKKLPFK